MFFSDELRKLLMEKVYILMPSNNVYDAEKCNFYASYVTSVYGVILFSGRNKSYCV